MSTIKINFDVKSLKQAIKEVEKIQQKLYISVPKRFLTLCADWVINTANEKIRSLNIGAEVIVDITSHWRQVELSSNSIRVINDSDKAVFIEFGVGRVAKSKPHPLSNSENYQYDIKNGKKDRNGEWHFKLENLEGIDLVYGYYRADFDNVSTKGSPANLYLYNSLMDLISSGAYKLLWERAKKETI